jgi:molybdopterin synthase catalytic subunit
VAQELGLIAIAQEPIDVEAVRASVAHPAAGAVASFVGVVRDHDHGRAVTRLEYEAHPDAGAVLAAVAREVADEFGLVAVSVVHRVGPLDVGDAALVAAVSSAHRAEAFAAIATLVDRVKDRLPVWKHQFFDDGTDEWVNCA